MDGLVGKLGVEGIGDPSAAGDLLVLPGVLVGGHLAWLIVAPLHSGVGLEEGVPAIGVAHEELDVREGGGSRRDDGHAKLGTEAGDVGEEILGHCIGEAYWRVRGPANADRFWLADIHQFGCRPRGAAGCGTRRGGRRALCRVDRDHAIVGDDQVAVDDGLLVGSQRVPVGLNPAHDAAA